MGRKLRSPEPPSGTADFPWPFRCAGQVHLDPREGKDLAWGHAAARDPYVHTNFRAWGKVIGVQPAQRFGSWGCATSNFPDDRESP